MCPEICYQQPCGAKPLTGVLGFSRKSSKCPRKIKECPRSAPTEQLLPRCPALEPRRDARSVRGQRARFGISRRKQGCDCGPWPQPLTSTAPGPLVPFNYTDGFSVPGSSNCRASKFIKIFERFQQNRSKFICKACRWVRALLQPQHAPYSQPLAKAAAAQGPSPHVSPHRALTRGPMASRQDSKLHRATCLPVILAKDRWIAALCRRLSLRCIVSCMHFSN